MSIHKINIVLLYCLSLLLPLAASAQNADDVLRYSLEYPSYDAQSMVMPGVTYNSGFGSFQENPAVMGLFEDNFGSFSLSSRNAKEETTFHGESYSFDDSQSNVGDLGFVYTIPTVQGSFVIGAGYSQTTDFNRALGINQRNNQSSLTDYYNAVANNDVYDAAFRAYAVDWADVDSTYTQSIFRIGFTPEQWPGIQQNMELTERGRMGEYSAFFATEFQQNLFVGASLGVLVGEYHYRREFLETDSNNDYDGNLIDSDGDGTGDTDIDKVLSVDTIDSDFTAFSARLGVLYKVNSILSIGGSYEIPNKLSFNEDYNTRISTTFDNGPGFDEEVPGEYSYKINRPGRFNVGFSLTDLNGFSISVAAERVNYSDASMELGNEELDYQQSENAYIKRTFQEVTNFRAGVEYRLNERFIPRIGYAWYPSPVEDSNTSRRFYNAGFSSQFSENIWFDLGVQYSTWDDQNQLYTYQVEGQSGTEVVQEDVQRVHLMAGIRIEFD